LSILKNTWFPTFGISPTYDIIKVSSLVTKKGFTLSWQPLLDMYVNLQLKLDRSADQRQSPYVKLFNIRSDPQLLMKELASRTCSWRFLRISAAIGGGVWAIEPEFRTFVLGYNLVDHRFTEEAFPGGLVKSPVFKTTQIWSELNGRELPLYKCRVDPVFHMKQGDGAVLVEYPAAAV
jgi:hypothetical protein